MSRAGQVASATACRGLSDTHVYEPYIRAHLGTAAHFCEWSPGELGGELVEGGLAVHGALVEQPARRGHVARRLDSQQASTPVSKPVRQSVRQ